MKKFLNALKIKYFFFVFIVAAILLLTSCSTDGERVSEISSATIQNDRNTLKVEITLSDEDLEKYKGERLYLVYLDSNALNDGVYIIGESRAKSDMTFRLKISDQKQSLLSSPLVLVKKSPEDKSMMPSYTAITEFEYINNPSILATENFSTADNGEIKGLESTDILDCSSIGAQKTLIEIDISTLMRGGYADDTINYLYDGVSYYFDESKVEELDEQIKTATYLGLKVYLRTVILPPREDSASITELYSATPTKNTRGCAINANNPEAMGYLRAFYSFLAERYNDREKLAIDIIIGEKVNEYNKFCLSGSDTQFVSSYTAWARVANNIFKAHNKNSKIYISVDGNMRVDAANALGSKVFLSQFAQDAKRSGNYDYGVALSLGNGEDIGDILSGKNTDLALVNANSFSSFTDLMSSEDVLLGDKSRDIMIDALSLPSSISEQNRAAYYSYTYYKAREAGFKALIYSANEENSNIFNAEGKRRDFFYSMLICGTQHYNQLYTYLGKIHDASIPKLADYVSSSLYTEEDIPCEISSAALRNRRELSLSICDMVAIGGAYDAQAHKQFSADGHEKTHIFMQSDLTDGTAALVLCNVSGRDIIESSYIGIAMYCAVASDVELIVSRAGGDGGIIYIGEAKVGSVEKTYFFDITPLTKGIDEADEFTLSVRIPTYAEDREPTLSLSDIALYGSSGSGSRTLIIVIIVALSTLAVCGLLFLLTRRRARKLSRDKD